MIFPVEVRHNQAEESSIVTDSIVNAIAASEVDLEAGDHWEKEARFARNRIYNTISNN